VPNLKFGYPLYVPGVNSQGGVGGQRSVTAIPQEQEERLIERSAAAAGRHINRADDGTEDETVDPSPSAYPDFENPENPPSEAHTWHGKGEPGTAEGQWVEDFPEGERWHNHPESPKHGPHWDYQTEHGGPEFRYYPETDTWEPKAG